MACATIVSTLPRKCGFLTRFERALRVEPAVHFDQGRDEPSPTGLVTCPQSRAVVTVEVLVEQDVVAKVRVILEFLRAPVNGAPALGIPREGADEPLGNFSTHLEQIHQLARASG